MLFLDGPAHEILLEHMLKPLRILQRFVNSDAMVNESEVGS
jgi:hypothetical protein